MKIFHDVYGDVSNCCGAHIVNGDGKTPVDDVKSDADTALACFGILLAAGALEIAPHDKCTIDHVKTKNGVLTVGVRHEW